MTSYEADTDLRGWPLKVKDSLIHGKGVFATKNFEKSEVVIVLDDSRIVNSENPLDPEKGEFEYHCDWLSGGLQVLMQIPERFINHCCKPNTFVQTNNEGMRCVMALQQIQPDEEITYDYLINCHGGTSWPCSCGHPHCRKTIPSSFFDLPDNEQKSLLSLLDQRLVKEHF